MVLDAANDALAFVIFPVVAIVIPGPTNDEYCAQPFNKNMPIKISSIILMTPNKTFNVIYGII